MMVTLRRWFPHAVLDDATLPEDLGLNEPAMLRYGKIELRSHDVRLLDDGEFLNDTMIDFAVRLAVDLVAPDELRDTTYAASTMFFQALTSKALKVGRKVGTM
jgi:Ulp1 family protease